MSPISSNAVEAPNGKSQANGANASAGYDSVRGGVDNDQFDSAELPEQSTMTFTTDAPMTIGPMAGGTKHQHRASIDNLAFDEEHDPPPYEKGTYDEQETSHML